jgi:hypothetical protein
VKLVYENDGVLLLEHQLDLSQCLSLEMDLKNQNGVVVLELN